MSKKSAKQTKSIKHTDAEVKAHMDRKAADKSEAKVAKAGLQKIIDAVNATAAVDAPKGKAKKGKAAAKAAEGGELVADRLGDIGTTYRKVYKGVEIVAKRVADRGFVCAQANKEAPDAVYESLTSVVRTITGMTNPNGPGWFGLASGKKEARAAFNGAALLGALRMVNPNSDSDDASEQEIDAAFNGDDARVTKKVQAAIEGARTRVLDAAKVFARALKVLDARIAAGAKS